jgi:hypothetical protein
VDAKMGKQIDSKYNQYRETNYCILLNDVEIKESEEYFPRIEKIFVKSDKNREEIRFCLHKTYFNKNSTSSKKLVPRPLDITESQLLELIEKSIENKIFSEGFLESLSRILKSKKRSSNEKI